jgi:hypothetical protein
MALLVNTLVTQSKVGATKEFNMLDTLFWIAIGAFVGWNFPQPFWAKMIQEKVQAMLAKK